MSSSVTVRHESVVLPTYAPAAPDRNPMFLETRVYQGSSGRVYPLPFIDRIAEQPAPRAWDAVFIENEFLLVMILPQLGGRIHRVQDKTNGYDLVYYQPVIKPALVGLAGPWASGGIEINWPQHHRPSTFMPTDMHVENHPDGAITVWLSEHDPMTRMKGMHGVCLHPQRAILELKARAHNRTADVQTFLWWANVATRVHEQYQSFFPPDATYVADHAKRAMSTFPRCSGHYYGVDYAARGKSGIPKSDIPQHYVPPHCTPLNSQPSAINYSADDLSWYANIPVPTSYMCMGTHEDFFGGYDHREQAGLIHVADHRIAPGKKQWTWGNHEFGYAWDRNLTDADAHGEFRPYIELMAGVFTDNQPDFSFLQPGETKAWSQYWYPIQKIGPAQHATLDAALALTDVPGGVRVGVAVTAVHAGAIVTLTAGGRPRATWTADLAPNAPLIKTASLRRGRTPTVTVQTSAGRELLRYTPKPVKTGRVPEPATEPASPEKITSADELYLIGLHLEQYRHATRQPDAYWREALRRDPGESRCHLALGRWFLRRGEFAVAEKHLRAAVARLTRRNPNPADGEAHYQLGRCLVFQSVGCGSELAPDPTRPVASQLPPTPEQLLEDAAEAFGKAAWSQAWAAPAGHALAEIDCTRQRWPDALAQLDRSLRLNPDNLRARALRVIVLRKLHRDEEAAAQVAANLALDPLDWWSRHLGGEPLTCDTQTRLDLALDYARAGCHESALAVLGDAQPEPHAGTAPLLAYYRAWLCSSLGDKRAAAHRRAAAQASPDYCFPARLEEIAILEHALAANPRDARAAFYLGNLLYDRRRHREAIARWRQAVKHEPRNAIAWRNLGIGAFNILQRPALARLAYDRACRADPTDARLLYERDQLWKRLGVLPAKRLRELERHSQQVAGRDDLTVEFCTLLNHAGEANRALPILAARKFQPWEGGEGQALGQHARTHVLLGRAALAAGQPAEAAKLFSVALVAPRNLGEARHLLANQSDLHFWLGEALAAVGNRTAAREQWTQAATFRGDFQEMAVRAFSEMTYYSALAWHRLGQRARATRLLRDLLAYARQLAATPAKIDYFATSLPTMLLFADDLAARQNTTALFLEAQARLGLGETTAGRRLLRTVLVRDPSHAGARDLLGPS